MTEETLVGASGLRIFTRSWRPKGQARAAIVLVHGFKAHSGMFQWAGERLAEHGIASYALDLRGHGRSEGERLYVDEFNEYLTDVDDAVRLARSREPGVPVFLLGHSAGGVISSAYVLEHQRQLAGFICESFAQEVPAPNAVLAVVRGLSHVAPHAGVFDLKDDDFSRDPMFVERMKQDRLITHARYPSQTVAEMARAEDRMAKAFPRITLPVFIMHGTFDKVTKPHGSQLFYDTTGSSDKTLRLYEGHFHDLLNDVGRERVMADIKDWIDRHIPRRAAEAAQA